MVNPLNLYSGRANAVNGVVVVRLNGETYRGTFALQATQGNQARDRNRRDESAYWVELDLPRIVGINASTLPTSTQ